MHHEIGTLQIRMFVFTSEKIGKYVLVHRINNLTLEKTTEFITEFITKNKKVDWELSWQADPIHLTK